MIAAGVLSNSWRSALDVDGDEETPLTWSSRYQWLLAPVAERFPPADEALKLSGFRVAGVHYWQGNWNFNFWTNFKVNQLDDDLRQISEHGFNTILVTLPWGYFQPAAFPPSYDEKSFNKLALLFEAAARHHLYVILRVGTSEELPEGIRGRPFIAPYLLLSDEELAAYGDLFRETAKRVSGRDNLLFLFFSWEDVSGHSFESQSHLESRFTYMKGASAFRDHLSQQEISHWNDRWRTSYQSLEEMPFPAYGSRAYADFLEFADERLMNVVLPAVARAARQGSPDVRLTYEIRVDSDPIWARGLDSASDWFDHSRTWNLIPGYGVVSAYFNPAWGTVNEGGFITAEKALEHLTGLLEAIRGSVAGKPIFFDQFNFAEPTPTFRSNTRLDGEEEIARFLESSLDLLRRRSLGYALWAFRAYEINSLYNSSFEDGLRNWEIGNPDGVRVEQDGERQEKFLHLRPGGMIRQRPYYHMGFDAPFDLRLMARSRDGGRLSIRFEVLEGLDWQVSAIEEVVPTAEWKGYRMRLSSGQVYRLTLESIGSGAVEVDELSLFNHVESPSVLDQQGEPLGRRSEILTRTNRSWRLAAGKIGVEMPLEQRQERQAPVGHIYDDGWVTEQVDVPLLSPWFDAALELVLYLPVDDLWSDGNSVQIDLEDRSLGQHFLSPGLNRLFLLLGEPRYPRWSWMRLSFEKSFSPQAQDPSSSDERALAAVLVSARVVGQGPEQRYWRGEVAHQGVRGHLQAVVQVVDRAGAPLNSVFVVGHAGGRVGVGTTDRNGQTVLKLEMDGQEERSTPVFVEVLDSQARILKVDID